MTAPVGWRRTRAGVGQAPVRLAEDLAEEINLVAKVTKRDVADILSPVVRDFIEREYAKAVKILAERVKPDVG
jgi:hypothetical protein